MANCKLNRNILKENTCSYSLLKVTDIYLANYADVTTQVTGNQVTAITMVSGASFYHIEPSKDSASFTDELQVTDGGAKYRTHTLNFSVDSGSYDPSLANDVDALSLGRFVAVAKLASQEGRYIMIGRTTPLEATSANVSGAASASEATAIEVVMSADTMEVVLPLSDAAVESLLAAVPTSNS